MHRFRSVRRYTGNISRVVFAALQRPLAPLLAVVFIPQQFPCGDLHWQQEVWVNWAESRKITFWNWTVNKKRYWSEEIFRLYALSLHSRCFGTAIYAQRVAFWCPSKLRSSAPLCVYLRTGRKRQFGCRERNALRIATLIALIIARGETTVSVAHTIPHVILVRYHGRLWSTWSI